jgi:hypothetical protein
LLCYLFPPTRLLRSDDGAQEPEDPAGAYNYMETDDQE